MKKLELKEIKALNIGESVIINPVNPILKGFIPQTECILISKKANTYTFFQKEKYEELYLYGLSKEIIADKFSAFGFDYFLESENLFEVLVEEKEYVKDNSMRLTMFVLLFEGLIENEIFLPMEIIKEMAESLVEAISNHEDCDIIKISTDLLEDRMIQWNPKIKELKVVMNDEEEKTKEVEVTHDFMVQHMFNDEITYRIEHDLYEEIIQRAVDQEDYWMECEDEMDTMNNFLGDYMYEDSHTYMDIMKFLTFYADTLEIEEIMTNGTIYAI